MRKTCEECQGTGFVMSLDGDGYSSEVICSNCDGVGSVENPDGERE